MQLEHALATMQEDNSEVVKTLKLQESEARFEV
jgi:hypothetical protein